MTKNDFVKKIAETASFTQKDVRAMLSGIQDVTLAALAEGDEVTVLDGLKLYVKDVAERTARNLQTGENMVIPAHKAVKAKLGTAFKKLDIA